MVCSPFPRRPAALPAAVLLLVVAVLPCTHGPRDAQAAPPRPRPAAPTPIVVDHTCIDAKDAVVPVDALNAARALHVVFGHQSVGFDVIRGLRLLSDAVPARYAIAIQSQIRPEWFARNAGLGEFFLGRNGDPAGKIDAFATAIRDGFGERVDVAMMKLCYADLVENSDPKAVFERWKAAYEGLAKDHPKVRFVWWTVPLTLPPRCSDKRTQANDLIRAYVKEKGALLLDVADIECHAPDGKPCLHPDRAEKLVEAYARDQGGHLNDEGAQRVGRGLWWLLARIAGWAGPKPAK